MMHGSASWPLTADPHQDERAHEALLAFLAQGGHFFPTPSTTSFPWRPIVTVAGISLGGSGRLDRLCLPAGAVKPPFRVCVQQSAVSKTRKKHY